jgi:hypothetical protein
MFAKLLFIRPCSFLVLGDGDNGEWTGDNDSSKTWFIIDVIPWFIDPLDDDVEFFLLFISNNSFLFLPIICVIVEFDLFISFIDTQFG